MIRSVIDLESNMMLLRCRSLCVATRFAIDDQWSSGLRIRVSFDQSLHKRFVRHVDERAATVFSSDCMVNVTGGVHGTKENVRSVWSITGPSAHDVVSEP
jgi:hypothetical protein